VFAFAIYAATHGVHGPGTGDLAPGWAVVICLREAFASLGRRGERRAAEVAMA
jgi:hypothetical protein